MREEFSKNGTDRLKLYGNQIQLKLSSNKAECPVNLIIRKDILYKIAGGGFFVNENGIQKEDTWKALSENKQLSLFDD